MFYFRQFLTAASAFVLWAGTVVAQNVIVIPDSGGKPLVVTPTQTTEAIGIPESDSNLIADFQATDFQPELIFAPELIAAGKVGVVIVYAEKGKKASKPIPGCKGPISVRINVGSPRSQGTVQCGDAFAHCNVPLTKNGCKAKSNKPSAQSVGECRVLAGSADGAVGFCMFTKP